MGDFAPSLQNARLPQKIQGTMNTRSSRIAYAVLGGAVLGVGALTAIAQTEPGSGTTTSPAIEPIPAVVTLEGAPEVGETHVRLRRFGAQEPLRELGTIRHAEHGARRGALYQHHGRSIVLVTAAMRPPSSHTYESQLYALENGATRPLTGEVANASAPLVTARGTVLVSRGVDGVDPDSDPASMGQGLRERVDTVTIDAVDLDSGRLRNVFRAQGQIAWLGCALREDKALVYHVTSEGAFLRVIDAANGGSHMIMGPMPALARDFSYDRERDEITFARARSIGSDEYEIVTVAASGGAARVRLSANSDHLMPRVLRDGTIAFSPAQDPGLALLERNSVSPRAIAPLGAGSDWVAAERTDGRWIAIRHLDPQSRNDVFVVSARDGSRRATFSDTSDPVEFVDFWAGATP